MPKSKSVVGFLKSSKGGFVSGAEIANRLGISRAAVWKHIQSLRKQGYEILSRENRGYSLKGSPDLLLPSEVQSNLSTEVIGREIVHRMTVDSTNRIAKELARNGGIDGTVVIAEEQTGGRGRLGRSFYSPKSKGILISIILKPKFLPHEAPKCTLMAAVAVSRAMVRFGLEPSIKWPNDIVHDGRKLVGILTEISAEMSRIEYIVVGIGINVNIKREDFPPELQDISTSLFEMKGESISRVEFLKALLEEFDQLYIKANQNEFEEVLAQWRQFNVTLGRQIRVLPAGSDDSFIAQAVDIDNEGALIVKTQNGLETIYAGDVSIRE